MRSILVLLCLTWVWSSGCAGEKKAPPRPAVRRPSSATNPIAVLETSLGTIKVELFEDDAPNTVANFVHLCDQAYYDGTKFHRVIKGFMLQGGDPNSRDQDQSTWGMGGPGWQIPEEPNSRRHDTAGILSMANSGPNTGGSQFFILFRPASHLDGRHTIFGQVVAGLDVVQKFEAIGSDRGRAQKAYPTLLNARVENKRDHPYTPRKVGE